MLSNVIKLTSAVSVWFIENKVEFTPKSSLNSHDFAMYEMWENLEQRNNEDPGERVRRKRRGEGLRRGGVAREREENEQEEEIKRNGEWWKTWK